MSGRSQRSTDWRTVLLMASAARCCASLVVRGCSKVTVAVRAGGCGERGGDFHEAHRDLDGGLLCGDTAGSCVAAVRTGLRGGDRCLGRQFLGSIRSAIAQRGLRSRRSGGAPQPGLEDGHFDRSVGNNDWGQCDVPSPNADFTAVAASAADSWSAMGGGGGGIHSLGLKRNGAIVAWGDNSSGQCDVPAPNTGFTTIAAGLSHSLGLKADGSIVAWGNNYWGQCDVPAPNAGFVAIAAGASHSLGLKSDGSIVAWGNNWAGQCDVPEPNTGFVAIAAGGFIGVGRGCGFSLGLKSDGSIAAWGACSQCPYPSRMLASRQYRRPPTTGWA